MDIKQIKELMGAMRRAGMTKVRLKKNDFELLLECNPGTSTAAEAQFVEAASGLPAPLPAVSMPAKLVESASKPQEDPHSKYVTSPMVGTFYAAPSPEAAPYIKVGDTVKENTVVCIVLAMKVMNEIKASVSGTIAEVLVENGQPVEFGTKLFRVS